MNDSAREIESLKRRILFLEDTLKQFTQVIPPMDPFERALMEVSRAVNGEGKRINLYTGPNTSQGIKAATRRLIDSVDEHTVHLSMKSVPPALRASAALHAEAAYYRNLALLANATAEALSTGR